MKTLNEIFLDELADMLDAETRITEALPEMIDAATCNTLQKTLQNHWQQTKGHVDKVQRVFAAFSEKPREKKCSAMAEILSEGSEIASETQDTPAINAAIIFACQKVEHYEIASYGALHAWAETLGNLAAANLLEEILAEEKTADRILTELAKEKNAEANAGVGAGELAVDSE